jgi:PAS domain S-box-containing protein
MDAIRLRKLGAFLLVVVGAAALIWLGAQIAGQLRIFVGAPQDSVGWAMSQAEVELLRLVRVAESPAGDAVALNELRKRYDIFYSRLSTIEALTASHEGPESQRLFSILEPTFDRLKALAPLVDASDEALARRRSELASQLAALLPAARDIALGGVTLEAAFEDRSHVALFRLFVEAGILAAALILALAAAALVLLRQRRIASERASEIERINDRYARAIDASLDAIIVTDARGAILDFNPAAERTFGYSRAAALGSEMVELIAPARLRDAYREALRQFFASGERVTVEAMRASGETFPIEFSVGVAEDSDGPLLIAFVRDISEQLRAQQELTAARDEALAAARAKSQFLAVISHEMRTPLNGVLAVLDLLAASKLDARQRRFVEMATASGEILQNHINDVLEITHFESGRLRLYRTVFRVGALIAEVIDMNAQAAKARGDALVVAADSVDAEVYEDRLRLSQVLVNLVSNAVKFTKDGSIVVRARLSPSKSGSQALEIEVQDTGVGVPLPDQARIFEEFVSTDAGYHHAGRGYGLGLAICRRIARALDGEIGLESEPGVGSRFWLRLPLRQIPEGASVKKKAAAPAVSEAALARSLKVLLVEDNDTNRLVAREMLLDAGCEVTEARDGADGCVAARAERFDLILMDVSMPNVDGVEAASAIRADPDARSREAPIVALTAHALPEDREALIRAGMQTTLIKPLRKRNLDRLLAQIRSQSMTDRHEASDSPAPDDVFPPQTTLVNLDVYREIADLLSVDLLAERLDDFWKEIDAFAGALDDGEAAGDVDGVVKLAHRLAGAAAVFGAEPLRIALNAIETGWRRAEASARRDLSASALALAARTKEALAPLARG